LRHKLGHKIAAIIELLSVDPRPFGWIDDDLVGRWPKRIRELELPKLLIKPDTRVGITGEHVGQLVAFASAFAARPKQS
jgi:hypothetical protein